MTKTRSALGWLVAMLVFVGVGVLFVVLSTGQRKTDYGIGLTLLGCGLISTALVQVFVRGLVRARPAEVRTNSQASQPFLDACFLGSVGSLVALSTDWLVLEILGFVITGGGILAEFWFLIKAVPAGDRATAESGPLGPSTVPEAD